MGESLDDHDVNLIDCNVLECAGMSAYVKPSSLGSEKICVMKPD